VGLAKSTSMPKGTGMKMEIDVLSVGRGVAISASVATVIALVLLGWIGGELHYQSCIRSAEARHPVAFEQARPPTAGGGGVRGGSAVGSGGFVVYPANDRQARSAAIADCSRWP
jgi:hypothetical protein